MINATAEASAAQEFDSVVALHRAQIFRFLLASTRDVDLAETLTQDCFLKAHRNWASFRGESSVLTWLMRIGHQPAKGPMAQSAPAVLAPDADQHG